jgi:hypothetical protein
MVLCAYCDTECVPTREHVIPDWYISDSDGWETFNAKRPTTHTKGPLLIRDVCKECNNVRLGKLDSYAKDIYERYLKQPAWLGESTNLEFDRRLFLRWLLKVCYNSARVHGSDVRILSKYRRYALGLETSPEPVAYVHLVTATDFTTTPPSASRRIIGGHPDIKPARWFRVVQFRGDMDFVSEVVQRQVYVDSFCFTLFAADPEDDKHPVELSAIEAKFKSLYSLAKAVPPQGPLTLAAGQHHAAITMAAHMRNYPARYGEGPPSESPDFSELLADLVSGKKKNLLLAFTREEVEAGDIGGMADRLKELVATRESALAAMQRISIFTSDYDDDSRELWDILEVRTYLQRVFAACPFLFFLAYPGSKTVETFMCCCCKLAKRRDDGFMEFDRDDLKKFLFGGFDGLNQVTQRFVIGSDINRAITDDVMSVLSDGTTLSTKPS